MNIRNPLIIVPVVAVAAAALTAYVAVLGSEIALFEKYPDHDWKIVVKVHREMLKESLTGKYADLDRSGSDADWDRVFRKKLAQHSTAK